MSRYLFNTRGHHVKTERGHYRMDPAWIDTDNTVWGEPYHLYGDTPEEWSRTYNIRGK